MRLVHDAEGDFRVRTVFLGELFPDIGELGVGGAALTDDLSVPAGVVVEVEDAEDGVGGEAALDEAVVLTEVVGVESKG